jgi:sortase A
MKLRQEGLARHRVLLERTALGLGAGCLVVWGAGYVDSALSRRQQVVRFSEAKAAIAQAEATPDQSLWSPERVVAWRNAINESRSAPVAMLRIPRIRLEAPVVEGTDEISLNRGLGHIEETAAVGTDGNAGIAGHRDGFFRGLKDIAPGDAIELETLHAREVYRVEHTWIVVPEDVSVLDPTPTRSLTLVTCYPFYFVGSAPQRFIVRAVLAETTPVTARQQQ